MFPHCKLGSNQPPRRFHVVKRNVRHVRGVRDGIAVFFDVSSYRRALCRTPRAAMTRFIYRVYAPRTGKIADFLGFGSHYSRIIKNSCIRIWLYTVSPAIRIMSYRYDISQGYSNLSKIFWRTAHVSTFKKHPFLPLRIKQRIDYRLK